MHRLAVSPDRLRSELVALLHDGDPGAFALRATRLLGGAVPFDAACVVTMDPATRLPTRELVDNGLPPAARARMAEIEFREGDVNSFDALARSGRRASSLSAATDGDLDRSVRHREVRAPLGFGDELRVMLVDEGDVWGAITLLRGGDHEPFSSDDVARLEPLSGVLAEGVRRALVLADRRAPDGDPGDAGLLLLDADNAVRLADAPGETWLAELAGARDTALPFVVGSVAARARRIADGGAATAEVARARVRAASGMWLIVRASVLGAGDDAETAVTFEPARPHELAPLIADAFNLTERERVVTQLVARGLSTGAIAARLQISSWTVQDHLKSIFDKLDVRTRGELVARLFFEHFAPRLSEHGPGPAAPAVAAPAAARHRH
jgi:DNA-binding CsgD family transcriptional regulator